MNLEKRIAAVARTIFLPEFSYAANKFKVEAGELELADHVIWVGDVLLALQMKERKPGLPEGDWFENKVLREATKQVRDTLAYLTRYDGMEIENQRGHRFPMRAAAIARKFMVVVYDEPASALYRARPNHHVSRTAGLIHLLRASDLIDVCRTLITLPEIASYLEFRDKIVRVNGLLSERAMLGQFLRGAVNVPPDEGDAVQYERFHRDRSHFDTRRFFIELPKTIHTFHNGDPRSYYGVLQEYALLDRFELEHARIRIKAVNEGIRRGARVPPLMIVSPRNTCFVLLGVPRGNFSQRQTLLVNFMCLGKYRMRAQRCVGMAFALKPDGNTELELGYMDEPWVNDPLAEEMLDKDDPFLRIGSQPKPRYRID